MLGSRVRAPEGVLEETFQRNLKSLFLFYPYNSLVYRYIKPTFGYKCWFDEVNGEKTTNSWYSYLGIKKPAPKVVKGDVDGDGKITAADARKALRAASQLETLTETQKKAADVNNDGKVTAADARTILRQAANLE